MLSMPYRWLHLKAMLDQPMDKFEALCRAAQTDLLCFVVASGLKQSQNSQRLSWSREEIDERLKKITKEIHGKCQKHGGAANGKVDYVYGANIGGFVKVVDAMLAYRIV